MLLTYNAAAAASYCVGVSIVDRRLQVNHLAKTLYIANEFR